MIGIFNTITINGVEFYRPTNFALRREDVLAGEYTTCTGKLIADRIGWKYSDMTLSWDTLPQSMLDVLTGLSGPVQMVFTDSDGSHTETIIRGAFTNTPTRFTASDESVLWRDVAAEVRFINVHSD